MKNWFSYIGLAIGIIGIFLAIFFYFKSQKYREPVFLVNPTRTVIIDKENISKAPIKIFRNDGTEIKNDLSLVIFYFWNRGELAIKREHLLSTLKIIVDDLNTNILDFKLLGYSRSVIDIRLSRSNNNPLREINIDFKILEKNDGFTGQILLEGNKEAKIKLKGDIEGVDLNAPKLFRWYDYVNLPTLISSIIIIMISTLFLHSVLRKGSKYNKKEKII